MNFSNLILCRNRKLQMLSNTKSLNIIFRNTGFFLFGIILMFSCKGGDKSEIPKNAINPSVIENPTTASGSNSKKDMVPKFQFEKNLHDFGTITEGEKVSYAFRFTNVGKGDLVIRAAQGSCGCTVPEFPKEAIKPGEGGLITVTFNSEGKPGEQVKTIDVISNTIPNVDKLTIKANVLKATE